MLAHFWSGKRSTFMPNSHVAIIIQTVWNGKSLFHREVIHLVGHIAALGLMGWSHRCYVRSLARREQADGTGDNLFHCNMSAIRLITCASDCRMITAAYATHAAACDDVNEWIIPGRAQWSYGPELDVGK